MNTTICLYHATACYTYYIVVIFIRLTLIPGFCTGRRNRTHINGFGDRYSTVKLCPYKSEKICEPRTEETPATVRGLHYHFGFTFCCVAPYELSRNSTPFTKLSESIPPVYMIIISQHSIITSLVPTQRPVLACIVKTYSGEVKCFPLRTSIFGSLILLR